MLVESEGSISRVFVTGGGRWPPFLSPDDSRWDFDSTCFDWVTNHTAFGPVLGSQSCNFVGPRWLKEGGKAPGCELIPSVR